MPWERRCWARLVYVVTHWAAYRGALLSALSPIPMGGVVALIYWSRRRLPVGTTLDALAPGLALAVALERLGAFLDGRDFGEPTTWPWGVYLWDAVRHPVQLYELAALLVIFGILWWQEERRRFEPLGLWLIPFKGYTFVLFVALYAGARLFLEAFRARYAVPTRRDTEGPGERPGDAIGGRLVSLSPPFHGN